MHVTAVYICKFYKVISKVIGQRYERDRAGQIPIHSITSRAQLAISTYHNPVFGFMYRHKGGAVETADGDCVKLFYLL